MTGEVRHESSYPERYWHTVISYKGGGGTTMNDSSFFTYQGHNDYQNSYYGNYGIGFRLVRRP